MSIVVGFAGGYFVGGILYKVMYGLFSPAVVIRLAICICFC